MTLELYAILYALTGVVCVFLYDLLVYKKLYQKIVENAIRMSIGDWDKAYDCAYLMRVNSQPLSVIFSVLALLLWPATLIVMEIKRHIACRIMKKYRRDEE